MQRVFPSVVMIAICAITSTATLSYADEGAETGVTDSKPDTHRVKLFVEPKSVSLFDWKAKQKITLGVQMTSDKGRRVAGLATDVRLIASKSRDNRVELLLAVTEQEKMAIMAAAKVSEFWFLAMPFKPEHRQAFEKDVRYAEFLKENDNYRPFDDREWGLGLKGEPIVPPTPEEIKAIRKADLQEISDH